MNVYDILEQLAATTSKNEKEAILTQYKDDDTLKEVFRLTYSPTVQFYIKKVPEWVISQHDVYEGDVGNMFFLLDQLSKREITGNAALDLVQHRLSNFGYKTSSVAERIIKKDLRCGVGESTINKVWKNLIIKPPRQGAMSMNEKSLAKIAKCKNLAVELKSDGSYASSICGEETTMMSRNGNPLDIPPLQKHLSCGAFDGFVLEGEIVYDTNKADRITGNGIVTKIVKGTASEDEMEGAVLQVWDCIDTKYYGPKGEYPFSNEDRREFLEGMHAHYLTFCKQNNISPKIILIERREHVSIDEAFTITEKYWQQGLEGSIVKDMDATWKDNGKPSWCVKIKKKDPADLEIVGLYEGEGKAVGMLGGVNLESSDGIIKVNIGSGFSDDERKLYWENPNLLLGRIAVTEYNDITENKVTKQKSLFLPIWKGLHNDKTIADSYKDILEKQH